MKTFVTERPWHDLVEGPQYGAEDTYRLAAKWLAGCDVVADWGGAKGFFRGFLPPDVEYVNVDGTEQTPGTVLADLAAYRRPSDGILLRHVLDMNVGWTDILRNAMRLCRLRMVVVTYTPPADETRLSHVQGGWPVMNFNPRDLRVEMRDWLAKEEIVRTQDLHVPGRINPEHVYYMERP